MAAVYHAAGGNAMAEATQLVSTNSLAALDPAPPSQSFPRQFDL